MKRFHIHIGVNDLDKSIQFYSALFGAEPVKRKEDYAKWMLSDPKVNFAISTRTNQGIDHLGIQVDEEVELTELTNRLKNAQLKLFSEGETTCCYANSKKAWVQDPTGIPWETYHTMNDAEVYSAKTQTEQAKTSSECCVPARTTATKTCC